MENLNPYFILLIAECVEQFFTKHLNHDQTNISFEVALMC